MKKTYRYRLYPNSTQTRALNAMMFHSKRLYNLARIDRIYRYQTTGESITWQVQSKRIVTHWRKLDEGFSLLPYDTANYIIKRLDKAYQAFFKRVKIDPKNAGFPKRMRFCNTLEFKYPSGIKLAPLSVDKKKYIQSVDDNNWSALRVMSVGDVRIRTHRPIPECGRVSYASITYNERSGNWYVQLTHDDLQDRETLTQPHPDMNAIGLDIGLKHAFVLSDGRMIEPEKHYESKLRELRILQRKLDRQRRANNPDCYDEKGRCIKRPINKSNRMKKTQTEIRKLHHTVAETRKEWLHSFTRHLVDTYDLIAIEDLSPQFMIKNKRLALKTLDISFSIFKEQLEYKCKQAGKLLIKVDPAYTSQTCFRCGEVEKKNRYSQAGFKCVHCGHEDNADVNAAKNILTRAYANI